MKRCVSIFYGAVILLFLSSCAGPGERVPLSLSYKGETSTNSKAAPQETVVVFPLEDKREDPKIIGRRIHLSGKVDTYVPKTPAGENVAKLLVASLRNRGWDAHPAPSGIRPQDIKNNLVIIGTIQTLQAEAISRIGYTTIDARFAFNVETLDPRTGAKMTSKIANQTDPKVVFFHPESLQEVLNDLVSSGLNRIDLSGLKTP